VIPASSTPRSITLGRPFVDPIFDLGVIGGGFGLLVFTALWVSGTLATSPFPAESVPYLILLANAAHFGATTVRLYSKPGARDDAPFSFFTLPLVMIVVLLAGLVFAETVGRILFGLYLSLSPYHYASQTYGLAAMYAIRSGVTIDARERRALWGACMLPFCYALVSGSNSGLGWLVPAPWLYAPDVVVVTTLLGRVLGMLTLAAPLALLLFGMRRSGRALPVISWVLLLSNGLWWIVFDYFHAFVWGAISHSVQYLGIVILFHLRDHLPPERSRGAWILPTLGFYLASLGLGYALFEVWPYAFFLAGFTFAQSSMACVAVINLHHFITDRVIWRVRRDSNLRIVLATSPASGGGGGSSK
jgi:hypothetical protein